jgi:hypothetical protein
MAEKDDGYVRFRCKNCHQKLKIRKTFEGGNIIPCPRCGTEVTVPLANLDAIAAGADLPETGQPGRLNVDPELLLKRLKGEEEGPSGPGSVGGPPTLRKGWSPGTAFGRVKELDQIAAAVVKINDDAMGQIQRAFREEGLSAEEREAHVREAASGRMRDLQELVERRLQAIRQQLGPYAARQDNLAPPEREHKERLERAQEVIRLYGRHVLGVEV